MVLYSVAQSRPVLPGPPLPVVSMGTSVPPARIEPTWLSTKIFCSQAGLGRLNPPWLVQLLLVSVTWVASICTIWPIFSGRVIRPSRLLTRAWTGRPALRYAGWLAAEAVVLTAADADRAVASIMASTVAVIGLLRRAPVMLCLRWVRPRMLCMADSFVACRRLLPCDQDTISPGPNFK